MMSHLNHPHHTPVDFRLVKAVQANLVQLGIPLDVTQVAELCHLVVPLLDMKADTRSDAERLMSGLRIVEAMLAQGYVPPASHALAEDVFRRMQMLLRRGDPEPWPEVVMLEFARDIRRLHQVVAAAHAARRGSTTDSYDEEGGR
jgi:hypothetical protein